ncbi:unnamed protein product [Polarella glacialis]|uniref:Uncharacterized protein n=1 Tax=Polarella glacialis TaxID=89957 RepID=A0A813HTS3_POLGL|nr:unnamed protein product [Polarella glacialis]
MRGQSEKKGPGECGPLRAAHRQHSVLEASGKASPRVPGTGHGTRTSPSLSSALPGQTQIGLLSLGGTAVTTSLKLSEAGITSPVALGTRVLLPPERAERVGWATSPNAAALSTLPEAGTDKRRALLTGLRPVLPGSSFKSVYRYKGGEPGVWEMMQDNASQEAMRRRKDADESEKPVRQAADKIKVNKSSADLILVVLVFHGACNPLHLGVINVLRRAKAAVEAFHKVAVVGALVMPLAAAALRKQGAKRQLPFNVRLEVARSVIGSAEQASWIAVDPCQEGCLASAPGHLMDYLSEYARSRLYQPTWDTLVMEVFAEDTLNTTALREEPSQHRVPQDAFGKVPIPHPSASIKSIRTVIVEVPKQGRCDELLQASVQQLQDNEDNSASFETLRRLLGSKPANLLRDCALEIPSGSLLGESPRRGRAASRSFRSALP